MTYTFSKLIQMPLITRLRSLIRQVPIGRKALQFVATSISNGYEDRFQKELLDSIKLGDTVWDIGANIGFYTEKFLSLVGSEGQVVAIEPTPASAQICREIGLKASLNNLTVIERAFGSKIGKAYLTIDAETSVTNHLSSISSNSLEVLVTTGDELSVELNHEPNIIKIDVEGFEVEVLAGMSTVLASPNLKAVFVEVHFELLEEAGYQNGAQIIVQTLEKNYFYTQWIDFSHIVGFKK